MRFDMNCMALSSLFLINLLIRCAVAEFFLTSMKWPTPTSCANISIRNSSYGQIHSFNFYLGQSQPPNVSCSWTISNSQLSAWSNYILSVRDIELENDPMRWSNELSIWTGNRQISFDDINKRTYLIPTSSSSIQIFLRSKAPLLQNYNPYIKTNLRIRRFLIEFLHINPQTVNRDNDHYFHCTSSDILIPKHWRCNCIQECSFGDRSDELDCPLCSMYEASTSLLCHSHEIWCLPTTNDSSYDISMNFESEENVWMQTHRRYSEHIDPKGICVSTGSDSTCRYSTNTTRCQKILVRRQDNGQLVVDRTLMNSYETLCFVIIAKEEHKIKFLFNVNSYVQNENSNDFEWIIYDGSEHQNQLLASSNDHPLKEIIRTRQHHVATIIIHRRIFTSIDHILHSYINEDAVGHIDFQEKTNRSSNSNNINYNTHDNNVNSIIFNLTWLTSICPDDQTLCSGHFETKCFTAEQRCDGIWDCISGDDELGCSTEYCPTKFSCNNHIHSTSDQPRCFTWAERCNGNSLCANRTDEKLCTSWWCNSNNGTYLCANLNCIYEAWVCDGADDCGDRSDELNCSSKVPRRIVTAAVIGATICSTLFIIALGCTCKLFHLRTSERQTASRLLNPQLYIEQRRRQHQREHRQIQNTQISSPSNSPLPTVTNETRRIAPPSYNQTMGLIDENEERHAVLAEHLRLAGLANYISLPNNHSSSRTSRSSSRHRHRRHRRHRHHHHHHRRAHSEGSRVALLEPAVVVPNAAFSQPSTTLSIGGLSRIRSQLRSLFTVMTPTQSVPSRSETRERRHRTRATSTQTSEQNNRSCPSSNFICTSEPPPPYTEEVPICSLANELNPTTTMSLTTTITTATTAPTGNATSRHNNNDPNDVDSSNLRSSHSTMPFRLRKREFPPIHTLRDRMRQFISGSSNRLVNEEYSHPMQPTSMMSNNATTTPNLSGVVISSPSDENYARLIASTSMDNMEQPTTMHEDDKVLTP